MNNEAKFLQFVEYVLNDDNGISKASVDLLYEMRDSIPGLQKILEQTKATDGRFYIILDI